jgi:hypothetical protein
MKVKKQIELSLIVASATAIIPALAADESGAAAGAEQPDTIRPFHINIPEEALVDLRQLIAATRWPANFRRFFDRTSSGTFGIGPLSDYVLTVCDNATESCPVFPNHAKRRPL